MRRHEPDVRSVSTKIFTSICSRKRGLCEHEDALDDDHGSRHDVALLDATVLAREVVDRYVDGAGRRAARARCSTSSESRATTDDRS